MKFLLIVIIVIAIIVIKKKKKGNGEKTPAQIAKEKEKEEKAIQEKIANCTHEYKTLIYDGYKDELFREIDEEGHELKKCSKCGDIIKGDVIAKVNCIPVMPSETDNVDYIFKGKTLNAGTYTVRFDEIHYLIANKNWVNLDIEKGEIFLALHISNDSLEKSEDFPVGAELVKYLAFTDKAGNVVQSTTPLCKEQINPLPSETLLAYERYDCSIFDLSESQRMDLIREVISSHSVLLRVPESDCKLSVLAMFPDLMGEAEE